jgi:hypothetical protein
MKSLQEHLTTSIINESVKNLFVDDVSTRRKYSKQVWKILQDAYAPIGGIKGSGFNSIEDIKRQFQAAIPNIDKKFII